MIPTVHRILVPHPDNRDVALRSLAVRVSRVPGGTLALTYTIEGDLARMRVPPPRLPGVAQGLWRHTCCECFIAIEGQSPYHEFNFAPSGEWAAYAFAGYREGVPLADEALNPQIAVRNAPDRLEIDAVVALARLSSVYPGARLSLALSAVIEDDVGVLSYWALRHPDGKPDFHGRESFALEIE